MTIQEYKNHLNKILGKTHLAKKQINALLLVRNKYILERNPIDEECICTYNLSELWDEYMPKLKKCIYFLENYCDGILKELNSDYMSIPLQNGDVSVPTGPCLEEAMFNFDAFILSISAIMEYEERDYLVTQFKKVKVIDLYPKKEEMGLYWQLNLIRNRIVHSTGGRYINKENCCRFISFSSYVPMIHVNNGDISLSCTQIDACKDEVKNVLPIAIETGQNVFDVLFPARSGKGHGKKNPIMVIPNKDIYFDHVTSGVNLSDQIMDFIQKVLQAFFDEFCSKSKGKEDLLNMYTVFCDGKDSFQYQIKSVFECEENN